MQIYARGLRAAPHLLVTSLFWEAPRWPHAGPALACVAPDENHDWSSVGILKGPQLGVPGSACSSPFCMPASAGVLNPSSARLSVTRRLDSPSYAKEKQRRKTKEGLRGETEWILLHVRGDDRWTFRGRGETKLKLEIKPSATVLI